MRKNIIKKTSYSFWILKLTKEDLNFILSLIKESWIENIEVSSKLDYEIIYDDVEEIKSLENLKIIWNNDFWKIEIDFKYNIIYFSEKFELLWVKIRDFLYKKEKKLVNFYIKYYLGINLGYPILAFWLSFIKLEIGVLIFIISWSLSIFLAFFDDKNTIILWENFFSRNKDKIFLIIVTLVISEIWKNLLNLF